MTTEQQLFGNIDRLINLHQRYECVWSDFFLSCKDRIAQDRAFGCDYLTTAWGGMFNYEEFGTIDNAADEKTRLILAEETYTLAKKLKNND